MRRCTNDLSDVQSLLARLEQLELQNERLSHQYRRLKAMVAVMLCLFGFGWLWAVAPATPANAQGQRTPNIIRATGFVLVDKTGAERGSFSYNDVEQNAILALQSKEARFNVNCGREGAGFRLSHGKNDINLGCGPKGGTYLEMFDKDGKSIFEQRKP